MTEADIIEFGYERPRLLPTGEWAALQRMMFTVGLFLGIDETGWRTRFCFPTFGEAAEALAKWDGSGWPPGYWIKQKPEEVSNPKIKERE